MPALGPSFASAETQRSSMQCPAQLFLCSFFASENRIFSLLIVEEELFLAGSNRPVIAPHNRCARDVQCSAAFLRAS